jgi:leader peptidase (prepilin peptidase)/N-methyltransferase
MIAIPILLGVVCAVWVNGLADNLLREQMLPAPSILVPRCAWCDTPRRFSDWSAVVSTLLFSGRCRRCGAPRPFRDLLIESILWIGMPALWMTSRPELHDLLIGGFLFSAFLLFAVIDFEHRTVAVEAVGLVSILFLLDTGLRGADLLFRALAGGLGGFLIFLFLYFLGWALAAVLKIGQGIEPLGFGDVILATLVGFIVGWPGIVFTAFLSIVLGGLAGLLLLWITWARGGSTKHATMAYGPYLLAAGLMIYFYGDVFVLGIKSALETL